VKILLDTHILLWALGAPEQLTDDQVRSIESRRNTILVSPVSIAEIMIKVSIGKLEFPFDPAETIEDAGFEELPFDIRSAAYLGRLPFHHRDPFDRMLIAQSLRHDVPVMSIDRLFAEYECRLI
jgi:PIN domain nuclease of toxin-antitoxin system